MNIQNFMIKNLLMDIGNLELNRQKINFIFNTQSAKRFFCSFFVFPERKNFQ